LTDIFKDFYPECKNANLIKMVFATVKRFCRLFYTGKINLAGRQISKAQFMTVARI
jgi:hypothetical protein